jgi:inosine-uridine nucleoside N-ribohydrolase
VAQTPRPVILDTDIGDDIDDTWALAYLLRSPELDLRLVVTDYGDTVYRARVAAKLLEVAERTDVPIGVGVRQSEEGGRQDEWIQGYQLSDYPGTVHEDGVQAMIDTILGSEEPVTVIAIGPAPNLPVALQRAPEIAERARFVGMYGSVRVGYGGGDEPEAEWNVRAAPEAVRAILEAPWPVTLTPLDTCGLLEVAGDRYAAIRDSSDPLARAVIENYRLWLPHVEWISEPEGLADRKSTTLFDVVAVQLAFDESLVEMEELGLRVSDEGMTVEDPDGSRARCAMRWKDMGALQDRIVERLTGAAAR